MNGLWSMDVVGVAALNGLSYGLLLFLLSAGLTLTYGLLGVVNFAHGAVYTLGAYVAVALVPRVGWGGALLGAMVIAGGVGLIFFVLVLRPVQRLGHVAEMLSTFGLGLVLIELIQLVWGRGPQTLALPAMWQGVWLGPWGVAVPRLRWGLMGVALVLALGLWWVHARTRLGVLMRATRTRPLMAQTLGHDVPRLQRNVFTAGCALAGLAGVLGGAAFVVQPDMGHHMGMLAFVVVVIGGMGSLQGAWWAALAVGLLQSGVASVPWPVGWGLDLAAVAPLLPYALLALVLALRREPWADARGARG